MARGDSEWSPACGELRTPMAARFSFLRVPSQHGAARPCQLGGVSCACSGRGGVGVLTIDNLLSEALLRVHTVASGSSCGIAADLIHRFFAITPLRNYNGCLDVQLAYREREIERACRRMLE
jgi:hypothetical protein